MSAVATTRSTPVFCRLFRCRSSPDAAIVKQLAVRGANAVLGEHPAGPQIGRSAAVAGFDCVKGAHARCAARVKRFLKDRGGEGGAPRRCGACRNSAELRVASTGRAPNGSNSRRRDGAPAHRNCPSGASVPTACLTSYGQREPASLNPSVRSGRAAAGRSSGVQSVKSALLPG